MEILTAEFQAHLESVARKAGAEAAQEAIQNQSQPGTPKERQRNLINIRELAKETGISVPTLLRRRNEGLIEGLRLGGRVLYDLDKVMDSMQSTRRV